MNFIDTEIDPEQIKLESDFINAKYQYLKYVRGKYILKFNEQTKDYVWDDTHWYYKYLFPKQETSESSEDINDDLDPDIGALNGNCLQKKLYSKLCKICHPDKCDKPWAQDIFKLINDANQKNNITMLQMIYQYYLKYGTLDTFDDADFNKISIIKQWESENWYQWFTNPIMKEVLISHSEYHLRLERQKELLQKENEYLQNQIKVLQKYDK